MNHQGNIGIVHTGGFLFRLRERFRNLFKKQLSESFMESGEEAVWENKYHDILKANFTEIFANRLTNYTLSGSVIDCNDPTINDALQRAVSKWYKWVQMSFGVGRVFLVPYCIEDQIYTDIIPQGRAWVTGMRGDDLTAIGVLADIRFINREMYARMTNYEWDPATKTFVIENKAIRRNGAEVPLSVIKEWESIDPRIVIEGVDSPLFAYVDSPKDNRGTDRLQGAPITYGCDTTIEEIWECFKQYREEYEKKQTWLGVDSVMLDKHGRPDPSNLFKTFNGKSTDDLFEIFSPDIRNSAYKERIMELFARLEKQVGTSAGILTSAETSNATATQVRRSMYDTLAIVYRMRCSIEKAADKLAYIYTVYLSLLGIPYQQDYTVRKEWSNDMTSDRTEQLSELMQGHGANAVKTEEIRQFLFPAETPEESAAAVQEIKEQKPEPVIPDFFGE